MVWSFFSIWSFKGFFLSLMFTVIFFLLLSNPFLSTNTNTKHTYLTCLLLSCRIGLLLLLFFSFVQQHHWISKQQQQQQKCCDRFVESNEFENWIKEEGVMLLLMKPDLEFVNGDDDNLRNHCFSIAFCFEPLKPERRRRRNFWLSPLYLSTLLEVTKIISVRFVYFFFLIGCLCWQQKKT